MKTTIGLVLLSLGLSAQVPNLVKDINSGPQGIGFGAFTSLPNNNILFAASSTVSSINGIWYSDGSTTGTYRMKPLVASSSFIDFQNKKYFLGITAGALLWRTDGTLAGTDSLLTPGLTGGTIVGVYNNLLFFEGNSTATGSELWRSDGTQAGTYLVKDIWPGSGNAISTPQAKFTFANGKLYFIANDGTSGSELWVTDGTTVNTSLVKDIRPGSGSSNIFGVYAANNGIYFHADDGVNGSELWFSDGIGANTILLVNFGPGNQPGVLLGPPALVNNTAYLLFDSKTIYKTKGTVASTSSVSAFGISNSSITPTIFRDGIQEYNGELYYLLCNEYNPGPPTYGFTDTLFFFKFDTLLAQKTLVQKTYYSRLGSPFGLSYGKLYRDGPHFMYVLCTNNQGHLYIYNLAQNSVKSFTGSHNNQLTTLLPNKIQKKGNKIWFPAYGIVGVFEPCYVDLLTDSLKKIKPGGGIMLTCWGDNGTQWNQGFFELNNKVYFIGAESSTGTEIYETDFTASGTFIVKDIYPGSTNFYGTSLQMMSCKNGALPGIVTPNNIFFSAEDGMNGMELWAFVTSGNPSGITQNRLDDSGLAVYPNPGSGKFTISSVSAMNGIELYNLNGQSLMSIGLPDQKEYVLDLSELGKGLYFLEVKGLSGSEFKKLIIE